MSTATRRERIEDLVTAELFPEDLIPVADGARPPAEPPEEPGRRSLGLGMRIFLAVAVLLGTAIGGAVWLGSRRAQHVAEEKIRADLKVVPEVWRGYLAAQASARRRQVRSLVEEPGTRALLGEGVNAETFHDTAGEFARGLGASTVFLFDARGALLTRSDRSPGEEAGRDFSSVAWVQAPLETLDDASAFIVDVTRTGTVYLVAASPVTQGEGAERHVNGVLAAAFPLDRERAREVAGVTSAEIAFLANFAPRDASPLMRPTAATSVLDRPDLPRLLPDPGGATDTLLQHGQPYGPFEFVVDGQTFIGTALPILSGRGEPIAALLAARSRAAEMAAFDQIRRALLMLGGLTLLIALPATYLMGQALARPIREMARGAEAIARGQLDVALPRGGAGEVGMLARSFDVMVSELKAKAALEALVTDLQRRPGDITGRANLGRVSLGDAGGDTPPDAMIGLTFAERYEVLSVLGEGGMGQVYRVRDRELQDEVALKCLKPQPDPTGTPGSEILRQEIKLARMVTHPNVVRVHDFGESDGLSFFTMEYVPGTTLRELLEERGGLDVVPALQIAKQICRGLAAVHKAGVVHGDLKPHNVIVMGSGVVKLMDFGVARVRSVLAQGGSSTGGTPLYMSPEQARGGAIDERSDIYSTGVVMYEMFTGRCPFMASDIHEIMRMHLNEPPPNPRQVRPALPESLASLILTCLAKSRVHRPSSAADLDRLLMRVRL
jgi:eukaryotic-like serine/threonine-protein kinase